MLRGRHWVFTENDPDGWRWSKQLPPHCLYMFYQYEKAPTTGKVHLQGLFSLDSTQRASFVKKYVSATMHFEKMKGTFDQAKKYCCKDETRIKHMACVELGERVRQGQRGCREDIITFIEHARNHKRKRDMYDEYPMLMLRYGRGWKEKDGLHRPTRLQIWNDEEFNVVLLVGPTGTGKTRWVFDNCKNEDFYKIPIARQGQWFSGYDYHPVVLWDEFNGAMKLNHWLMLLDRYPCKVEVKGNHTWYLPKLIYVTSNLHPRKWYRWIDREEQYAAMCRRFSEVRIFSKDSDYVSIIGESGIRQYFAEYE